MFYAQSVGMSSLNSGMGGLGGSRVETGVGTARVRDGQREAGFWTLVFEASPSHRMFGKEKSIKVGLWFWSDRHKLSTGGGWGVR